MKTTLFFLTSVLLLSTACSSNMFTRDLEEENTLDGQRYGRVVYNPAGLEELVAGRRDDALKRAQKYCGANQRVMITKEARQDVSDMKKNPRNSIAVGVQKNVMVIDYRCES